jgi:hypothetical protein
MDDDPKTISVVEAFRTLLRARHPGPLADEIKSYDWFRHPETRRKDCDPVEVDAAVEASMRLQEGIKTRTIRLRGKLWAGASGEGPEQNISAADQREGELHIFDETLKIGSGLATQRCFVKARCVEADVMLLISPSEAAPSEPQTRLRKIVDKESALLPRDNLPKRDTLVSDIQGRHDLSGTEAEAVTKMIWPHEGKIGRPSSQKKG